MCHKIYIRGLIYRELLPLDGLPLQEPPLRVHVIYDPRPGTVLGFPGRDFDGGTGNNNF